MTFSSLIKEERKRLKLTQIQLADTAGVARETWGRYETGKLVPSVEVLSAVASLGVDVQYVLTGMRSNAALSSDEKLLLERYRAAPAAGKQAILGAALGQQSPVVSQKYIGSVGQVVESVQGDGLSFNVTMPSGETAKRPKK